jgi:Predicted membrane protein (DUF2142)
MGDLKPSPVPRQPWGYAALAIIVAAYFCLSITYSLVVPIFEAPDEPAHFEYVRYVADKRAIPFENHPWYPGYVQTAGHGPLYYALGVLIAGWIDVSDSAAGWPRNPYFAYGPDSLGANLYQHSAAEQFPFRGTPLAVHLLRVISVVLGAGTVIATWSLARTVFPHERWLPLGAAAFVAFLPQFIFVSASVNSDNLVNFLSALGMISVVRIGQGLGRRARDLVGLGLVVGLASLAKGSGLALIPIGGAAMLVRGKRFGWHLWLRDVLLSAATFLLVAGWWFALTATRLGDLGAYNSSQIAYPALVRTHPPSLAELSNFAQAAWISFWAKFGWGNIGVDERIYELLGIAGALALVGLAVRAARDWRSPDFPRKAFFLLLLDVVVVGMLFISFWYAYPVGGDQGRYMFTAVAPLAVLFVWGLSAYFPSGLGAAAPALTGIGLFALAAAVPFTTLIPAYQPISRPLPIAAVDVPSRATFSDLVFANDIRVYAFLVPSKPIARGRTFSVTFYWQAMRHPLADDKVSVRLVAQHGDVLDVKSRRPGGGRSPTDTWQTGDIMPDKFYFTVPLNAPAGEARLMVGFSERGGDPLKTLSGAPEAATAKIVID